MKSYYFCLKHPNVEIKIPTDGSKPPANISSLRDQSMYMRKMN